MWACSGMLSMRNSYGSASVPLPETEIVECRGREGSMFRRLRAWTRSRASTILGRSRTSTLRVEDVAPVEPVWHGVSTSMKFKSVAIVLRGEPHL